jgi:mercuric ion transport protein
MNSPERLPTETQAVHRLPVGRVGRAHLSLPFADSRCGARTTAGAFIGEHWGIAAITLTGLFVLSVTRLLRVFKERS